MKMISAVALFLILFLPAIRLLKALYLKLHQYNKCREESELALILRVSRVRRQSQYLQLTLVAPDGQALPPARAGQHIQLFGTDAAGQPVSRAYSLAQDCRYSHFYRLVIKAEPGGRLSSSLFDTAPGR
ncbi:MAG: FAD-binding oxidoreductase [Rheinheimera sp.]|nr:FAD-binding oxidoreductase [Rheinheimera sp.]